MSSLGSVNPILVHQWEGFDQPETAHITPLIGNSSGAALNAVMQQTSLGFAKSTISGTLTDEDDLAVIEGYHESKETVAFVHGSTTYYVRVFDLKTTRLMLAGDEAWTYICSLHKVS